MLPVLAALVFSTSGFPHYRFMLEVTDFGVHDHVWCGIAKQNNLWKFTRSVFKELGKRPEIDQNQVTFDDGRYVIVLLGDVTKSREMGLRVFIQAEK